MHIEPGFVAPAKLALANLSAAGVVAWYAKEQLIELAKAPWTLAKTALAALFFSLFMQAFHMPVGPSELHFVGAMAIYLTLGFVPTMLGFAIGLLFQGLLFAPTDLVHLGVNSLSLMLPLAAVHQIVGRKFFAGDLGARLSRARILGLDAMYYAGVTSMVGFWLWIGNEATALSSWLAFAASYLAVVAIEPLITWGILTGLQRLRGSTLASRLTTIDSLALAR